MTLRDQHKSREAACASTCSQLSSLALALDWPSVNAATTPWTFGDPARTRVISPLIAGLSAPWLLKALRCLPPCNCSCFFFVLSLTLLDVLGSLRCFFPQTWSSPPLHTTSSLLPDRQYHDFARRHHGEPNGVQSVPEREAEHAPLREIALALTRALTSKISRAEWSQAAAEDEGNEARGLHV